MHEPSLGGTQRGRITNGALALEARGLGYKTADGTALVDQVDLRVHEGEIVALAGPNGAGKSTLLKLLAGLLPPSNGDINLFGSPAAALSVRRRAQRIAFVDQREQPDGRLTTEEYVALGRIPHERDAPRDAHQRAVGNALDAVGLSRRRLDRLATLSGGESQRAVIARALCQEPSILFLDEPTNHLDPKAKGGMLSLIAGLGITTVCVLHDLALIPRLADQTVLLDDAAVVVSGATHDALSAAVVKQVFGVDFLHFAHPESGLPVSALDIPIVKPNQH